VAKRGFFAELNHQAQLAEKRRRQELNAAHRAQAAAEREAERSRKAAQRARASATRASAAEQKAAEKEAARLQVEARLAEVASQNAELTSTYDDIDTMLAWTLDFDDYVDLKELKIGDVEHPPFDPKALGTPTPAFSAPTAPDAPVYQEPPAPGGLSSAFGGKKRHAAAVEAAKAQHEADVESWRQAEVSVRREQDIAKARWEEKEARRLAELALAEAAYQAECEARQAEANERDAEVDKLINDLAFDVESAIEEYVGIVLSNSVYPDSFAVQYEYSFDVTTRELTLGVEVPDPASVPTVKEYKYVKARDEITSASLTAKAQKDRYAGAVWQVAVRSLHEIFEADREAKIHSVALTVGVNRVSPATGRAEEVPLAVVSADRETFNELELSNVVPEATLAHLGAALSKSPLDATPADTSRGVRARK
jgi:restriction system protein